MSTHHSSQDEEIVDWNELNNSIDKYMSLSTYTRLDKTKEWMDDDDDDVAINLSNRLQSILYIFRHLDRNRNDTAIQQIQQKAIKQYSIHLKLLQVIHSGSIMNPMDITTVVTLEETCQQKSIQLLSNLGTKNPYTAKIILSSIPWSSWDDDDDDDTLLQSSSSSTRRRTSWTDLILLTTSCKELKGRGRKLLVGIIATIHNCISSLQNQCIVDIPHYHTDYTFFQKIAENSPFINTCIRQLYPSKTIAVIHTRTLFQTFHHDDDDDDDEATQWISFLLMRLSSMGLFKALFISTSNVEWNKDSSSSSSSCSSSNSMDILTTIIHPEQVLLLYCLGQAIHEYPWDNNKDRWKNNNNSESLYTLYSPVGNCFSSKTTILHVDTLLYLAHIWCSTCIQNQTNNENHMMFIYEKRLENNQENNKSNGTIIDNDTLISTNKLIMEILTTSFSYYHDEDKDIHHQHVCVRSLVGKETCIFKIMIQNVYQIILNVEKKNTATNHHHHHHDPVDYDDLSSLIDHVRLIGNLCYKCKINQDLLRQTYYADTEELNDDTIMSSKQNNGLYLLLSCTSLALHCFPLREWTIVAIRNALENNYENQQMVQELQAHHAINTPELQRLGIDLNLDEKGNVIIEHES